MTESTMEISASKYSLLWAGFAITVLLSYPIYHLWWGIGWELGKVLELTLCSANAALTIWLWVTSRRKAIVALPILSGFVVVQWWWLQLFVLLAFFSIRGFAP